MVTRKRLVLKPNWMISSYSGSMPGNLAAVQAIANNLYYFDNEEDPSVFKLALEDYTGLLTKATWINPGRTLGSIPGSIVKTIVEEPYEGSIRF